jgi:hypothetical protein
MGPDGFTDPVETDLLLETGRINHTCKYRYLASLPVFFKPGYLLPGSPEAVHERGMCTKPGVMGQDLKIE